MATVVMNNSLLDTDISYTKESDIQEQIQAESEKIQTSVGNIISDKFQELISSFNNAFSGTNLIEQNNSIYTEELKNNINKFSSLQKQYYLPVPQSFTTDTNVPGVKWERERHISCGCNPFITKVEILFFEDYYSVYVVSDEYKLTKIQELGTSWSCMFNTTESLIIYLLQLKDLGFIQ